MNKFASSLGVNKVKEKCCIDFHLERVGKITSIIRNNQDKRVPLTGEKVPRQWRIMGNAENSDKAIYLQIPIDNIAWRLKKLLVDEKQKFQRVSIFTRSKEQ